MTNSAHYQPSQPPANNISPRLISASWWQRQSIRFKTIVLAIALGTIPTLAVGSLLYKVAAQDLEQQITALPKTQVRDLQNQLTVFMGDRLNDIEMMATLPILTDSKLREVATSADKSAALQKIQDAYGFYNSIAVFDTQGEFIAKTDGKSLGNHLNRDYIQAAIAADGAIISQPRISTSSGIFSIYTAAPIKDRVTGETIGFVRARMPVEALKSLFKDLNTSQSSQYYLLDENGQIFLGSAGEYIVKTKSDGSQADDDQDTYQAVTAAAIFEDTNELLTSSDLATEVAFNRQSNRQEFLAYAPPQTAAGFPTLNWQAIVAQDTAVVFAPQKKLRLVFILGTGLVALGVGAIAYAVANRLVRPILEAAKTVQKIGRGNFDVRVQIAGTDEIAQLGDDINSMAQKLAGFVQTQTVIVQQSESIKNITLHLANATEQAEILDLAVQASCQTLNSIRVVYYQLSPLHRRKTTVPSYESCSWGRPPRPHFRAAVTSSNQTDNIIAEAVAPGYPAIPDSIAELNFIAEYQAQNGAESVQAINNLAQADLPMSMKQHLTSLDIQSCLIAPVVLASEITEHSALEGNLETTGTKLDGLLIVHQATTPHQWRDEDLKFMTQVATQVSFAISRIQLFQQQQLAQAQSKSAKEAIQRRALSLLQEVYDVAEGNLTIRAQVTNDEIGTIADSYNSTIESLQKLVNQTKTAVIEVQSNTSSNNLAIQALAEETVTQATAIDQMLEQVKGMEQSINLVATQANQAEKFVEQATITIQSGDQAMNRTVAEINTAQQTITQTANKAEKLGESSQEISQAVNLISRFAAQTHLLALKASIEAARAGEQGKGFAVIADEVRSLATQSAEATAEIETLVNKIQLETSEVVAAMNQGAGQIASGNELVQQTRHSLTQISQVSNEISQLVGSITHATQEQSATSAQVTQTIFEVAQIANNNSQGATQVSHSIQQLSAIADKLQLDIAKFKT
ncbi:MAG: methyl-accepting chemotaxis protein [Cyanobacteria bacterium P01_A01_bin.83]